MSIEALGERASELHLKGYNCAQAVLLVLFEHMNPNGKNEAIPKIATGFGGGIGRCGSVCGALTGAVMAVGLKYGAHDNNPGNKTLTTSKAQALYRNFESIYGSVNCRDLIQCDISTPQGLAKAKQENAFETICSKLIKTVVKDFLELEKH